jgi:hypothetical protein
VPGGNATPQTATNFYTAVAQQDVANLLQTGNGADASLSLNSINAGLSTPGSVEYFKYQSLSLSGGFTVNVQTSGQSLLEAKVIVLSPSGTVLGSAVATDPENGNLSVHVANAHFGTPYRIEVESANDTVFGAGAYELQVVPDNSTSPFIEAIDAALLQLLAEYQNPHNTMANAAAVQPVSPGATLATTSVTINGPTDTEWLSVQAPAAATGNGSLTVTLWTAALGTTLPEATLVNANGVTQPTTLVTEPNGAVVLSLANYTPGARYYLKLQAAPGSTGGKFHVAFEFGYPPADAGTTAGGTVQLTDEENFNYFNLPTAGVVQFSASAASMNPLVGYEVTVLDSSGNIWYDQYVTNTSTLLLSTTLVLPEGNYEVRITAGASDGSDPGTVAYTFLLKQLNAPLGPPVSNPDNPPPQPGSAAWLEVPPAFLYLTNTDPYGRPFQYPIPGAPVNKPPLG